MIINHNLYASVAHRNTSIYSMNSGKNMDKLSSGLRINGAGDDAAGLAISEKMRSQIRGLNQSQRNIQDGISLIQTALGALDEMQSINQRIRELCVQAANGSLTEDERLMIQAEVSQYKEELIHISDSTAFNGKKLLSAEKQIEWKKTFGGSSFEDIRSILQTADGGYIIVGETYSNDGDITDGNNGSFDGWMMKLDKNGDIEWSRTLGGEDMDDFSSVQQTADGGYIVAGTTASDQNTTDITDGNNGNFDGLVMKFDADGNKLWDKTFGGSSTDGFSSIQQTADGGYIVAGHSLSSNGDITDGNNGSWDGWIVKLDGNGNKQWLKTLGGSSSDEFYSVQQTADGGYIIAGYTGSNQGDISDGNNGYEDGWIVKLDADGNKQWDKTLGGSSSEEFMSIRQTSDGGYILVGYTFSDDGDITDGYNGYIGSGRFPNGLVIKLDADGNKEWDKTFKDSLYSQLESIEQTEDGGYIVAGRNDTIIGEIDGWMPPMTDADGWIIKMDADGTRKWDMILGGSSYDFFNSIQKTADGGYIVAGQTESDDKDISDGNNGRTDGWVIKLAPDEQAFKIGMENGSGVEVKIDNVYRVIDSYMRKIQCDTQGNATNSIDFVDNTISYINSQRTRLGAMQNRFERMLSYSREYETNLTASESRIRDADMANETMGFTKNNLVQQSAQSVLIQASQIPQRVLQLLRN